jgi:hypothetical protein
VHLVHCEDDGGAAGWVCCHWVVSSNCGCLTKTMLNDFVAAAIVLDAWIVQAESDYGFPDGLLVAQLGWCMFQDWKQRRLG